MNDAVMLKIGNIQPKQREFMMARARYIGFGGARGGGKSHAVRKKAELMALQYPGIRILIIRRTYPLLKSNHIDRMREDLYGIARYVDKSREFIFPNGSRIFFGYCDNDKDADQYQGVEYDIIFIDEATTLREEWITKISACNRGVNEFPKRTYYTMNPGGEGHQYMKRLFIDRKYIGKEKPENYLFIQSLVTDNAAMMEVQPDYIDQLDALPPKLREAWRYGNWNIYEGMFFEEFRDAPEHYQDRVNTHVINPFDIPRAWPIYRSFDWGYAKPFSCGWWTVDYDGIAYRILELYGIGRSPNEGCRWDADRVFAEIARVEREHEWLKGKHIEGVADPAIWQKDGGPSIADAASTHNIYFRKADNSRIPGWMQCHYRMKFDENGIPRVYFFKNCTQIIRTLPLLVYDDIHVEDLDTSLEDHAADEFRYFCMMHPIKPILQIDEPAPMIDPLSMGEVGRFRRAL